MIQPYEDRFWEACDTLKQHLEELDKEEKIHYPGKYNHRQYFPEDIEAFYQFQQKHLPLTETGSPVFGSVDIFHEYYEYNRLSTFSPLNEQEHWREDAIEDAKHPKHIYIYRALQKRLDYIQDNFHACLESARQNNSYSLIKDDTLLTLALIEFYQKVIAEKRVLEIFYNNHLRVNRDISTLFTKALIIILQEKIHFIHPNYQSEITTFKTPTSMNAEQSPKKSKNDLGSNLNLPKLDSSATDFDLRQHILFAQYLKEARIFRQELPNRHLGIVLNLYSTYAWKNAAINEIKSTTSEWEDIKQAGTISFEDKKKYSSALNEIKSKLIELTELVDNDIDILNKAKTI